MEDLNSEQIKILQKRLEQKEKLESILDKSSNVPVYLITSWDSETDKIGVYDAYFDRIAAANCFSHSSALKKTRYLMTIETSGHELKKTDYGFSSEKINKEDLEFAYFCLETNLSLEKLVIEVL